ncbi:MAG: glycosyltransferase [Nocardia sp.]|uniref:glycosyltransferase family 4 protein n=1 Tax=Nocardia sp. TaxID=1821 RepID=UPI00262ABC96|nr:glycosyltransferase family 4 protein [Nocardia sp.]MCU1648146.1 glycosyltransferase [Nocardia sp.]
MTRPLSIALAGLNYAPESTGIAPYTTGVATGLCERGHRVRVLTGLPHYPEWRLRPGYQDAASLRDELDGVAVQRLRHFVPDPPSGLGRVRMEASFGAGLAAALRDDAVDAVVFVSPALLSTAMGLARIRLRSNMSRPAVGVWVQDLYSRGVVETGAMSGRPAQLAAAFESRVLRTADGVVAIHDRFKSSIAEDLRVPAERITVIRNWTHLQPGPVIDRAAARRRLGWDPESVIVLHTGNMGAKQGLDHVVAAAGYAQQHGEPVRFVLLGGGNQRPRLEELGRGIDTLQFLDPLPDEEYQQALAAADVLLVNERPGVGEMAVPSKLTSYFTTGNPVVAATDADSITAAEISASGGGLVVPPDDPAQLVRVALELGRDRERAHALGTAGRQFCARTLSQAHAIDQFEQWLTDLVETRARQSKSRRGSHYEAIR